MAAMMETAGRNGGERSVLDSVRIIETHEVDHSSYEVCATGKATYREGAGEMQVDLASFVRRFEMRGKDEVLSPAWLPRGDQVRMHVALDEAPEAAKEVFSAWSQKVRKSIPSSSEWQPDVSWLKRSGA